MDIEGQFGPIYPALGAGVAKFRRAALKAGGVAKLDRAFRVAYADTVERAIRSLQKSETARVVSLPKAQCASGTFHNDGGSISEAVRRQNRARFAAVAERDRRDRTPEQWAEMYAAAMAEKRRRNAEAYRCNACGDEGFGGWNCNQCGGHDIERRD